MAIRRITGTSGSDKIRGTSGADLIRGLDGDDKIRGEGATLDKATLEDEPDFSVAASLVALADPVAASSSPTRNKR